ncbi:serine protease 55 [Pteronotus mesoamericanus]|uniref:serine protease 55 n=1 Tax=Pteronotus mesoamericanus TaxID=1884717 RepID=UPI0023ECC047|nr:serine protease 55 [Pteronotus parnellii mesoamericanus]
MTALASVTSSANGEAKAMLLLSVLLLLSQAKGAHPECGERPIFEAGPQYSRITEGMEAEVGEFPWLVSIQAGNEHFCGGTIIDEWWIVTAAHCLYSGDLEPKDLSVVLGTSDLQSPSLEIKGVTSIVLHKDFERSNMNNDIALLLLNSQITFNDLKKPICMPRQPSPSTWSECWVAGWGQTEPDDKNSMGSDLMKVPMIIMDWQNCSKVFPNLTKNMLCAGYENENYDACQGDSGGPLVCTTESDKKWFQVGIVSWGRGCGMKNTPGVYTLLENYSPWIKKVTEVQGRPYNSQIMRAPSMQKPKGSQAPKFPEPGGPRLWFLLCLLPYMLFQAIFYW